MNKKNIILVIILIFLTLGLAVFYAQNPHSQESGLTVTFSKAGFSPDQLKVNVGDTVTFISTAEKPFWPASDLHPTHSIYPDFDSMQPVNANSSWSFTFTKEGNWRFHDHLYPNFTGSIIVGFNSAQVSTFAATDCSKIKEISDKAKCWNNELAETLKSKGLDEAFNIFVKLHNSEPEVPKSCHGWTHTLGKAAFDLYNQDKNLILRKEVSYCGYGFFHGFMERLIQSTGNIQQARDFCDYASKQLKREARGTYSNCVHGMGHGAVDVDNTALWGNFQALTDSGIKRCELFFTESEELGLCLDGVFNAMGQISLNRENNLQLNTQDIYSVCRTQKNKYKLYCYSQFTGLMDEETHKNFKKAVQMIKNEHLPIEIAIQVYKKLSADIMQFDIVNESQEENVKNCRSLPKTLYEACMFGLSTGFISHGEPGKEYIKALEFCGANYLNDNEKDICYKPILQQLISRNSPVCLSVPENYQKYCYD